MYPITAHDFDGSIKNADFTINLLATDFSGTGIYDTFYRLNLGPIKRVSMDGQPFISVENINNILEFWSRDNNSNQEPVKTLTSIALDKSSPFEVNDISSLNGGVFTSNQNRLIRIEIKDAILLANFVTLNYFRSGLDVENQTVQLHLNISGTDGIYEGFINENPDPANIDVVGITYWVSGTDAAQNPITLGGSESSPLSSYVINDNIPIFKPVYDENSRIGQTTTVANLGYANAYVNNQTIRLEVTLNKPNFTVTADFSAIDSNYIIGHETITNHGGGRYEIAYHISTSNTFVPAIDVPIPITAKTITNQITTNVSFKASTTASLSVVSTIPAHNANNVNIDAHFALQMNGAIIDDGLLTGHIYLTDSCGRGIPIDIELASNTAIVAPVSRLRPNEKYTIHVNPKTQSSTILEMNHYNEIVVTTGLFYLPLIPPGYSVSEVNGSPLNINSTSMKLTNETGDSIAWNLINNAAINGNDLRFGPFLLSDTNSATLWVGDAPENIRLPITIQFTNLTNLLNPKIEDSLTSKILFIAGVIRDEGIMSPIFSLNNLSFSLDHFRSVFVSESPPTTIVSDGQNSYTRIMWNIPPIISSGAFRLVRNSAHVPTGPTDGDVVFDGYSDTWYDIDLPNNIEQFYRLFVYDDLNRLYNYVLTTQATPAIAFRQSYEFGDYEARLINEYIIRNQPTMSACHNAVADIADNGNVPTNTLPVFREFSLGTSDVPNEIITMCNNGAVIEVNIELARELNESGCFFIIFENEAAKDQACNPSPITMFTQILKEPDWNELPIIHAKPIV